MNKQGTVRLIIENGSASVEKLWNGRFRLEFLCDNNGAKNDWYYENISGILPDYGILQDASFGTGVGEDWQAIPASVYPDMRLVETDYVFIPSIGDKRVQLAYETLTASWVEEKAEDIDYELNGLKRVSRAFVALPATPYTYVVGTTTITSDGTTLYLAGFKIKKTDAKWELGEIWLEAGTLSISKNSESEGVIGVTTEFFGVEGATVGPITSRNTGNYEGFPTISVKTLQDVNGNSLVNGGENLVNSISGLSSFTYPGILDVNYISSSTSTNPAAADNSLNIQTLVKKAPAQTRVKTTVYFIFQSSSSTVSGDYTYASSNGLWSPNHWAGISVTATGQDVGVEWNDSATFRGYRTSSSSQSGTINPTAQAIAILRWQGTTVVSDITGIDYVSTVDQGPPDPIGNTYTLDVQISPAFDDMSGNKYYKKVITVTDAIPTQPTTASLPYT
tara:strand:- start:196 stop:1539 length:1344 start_codon:yes stop_codon:yes gene_type:complete